ncbi:MAG: hypothetical protein P8X47_03825 [Ignavibacteriaceae bacterium]
MNRILRQLLIIALLVVANTAMAQLSLAPTMLFIHDNTNSTVLYVANRTNYAEEVTVSFKFGYLGSDSEGNPVPVYNDSVMAAKYSLSQYLRAFPSRFILKPNEQQAIRFQVKPFVNKPDGMYWTRVIVNSSKEAPSINKNINPNKISTNINIVFHQNIAAFYSKGIVHTGLQIKNVTTKKKADELYILSDLHLTGDAPFNGTVHAKLIDKNGKIVGEKSQTCAVYNDTKRLVKMQFPKDGLPSGSYSLQLNFETKRADVPAADLAQMEPLVYKMNVSLQ